MTSSDPRRLSRARERADAAPVAVRAVGPEAAAAIADMLRRCSADTLFQRVLGFSARAADQLVAPIRRGNPRGRVDLVAEVSRRVVGWGCLVPDAGGWEIALVIEDGWQGRGVGDRLADALLSSAAAAGAVPVRAVTTHGNRRVATLIRRRAEIVRPPAMSADEIEYWLMPKEGTDRN